jgi:hypothetical protein
MAYRRTLPLSDDNSLRAYVLGLAIGDGNLSYVNKTTRLRISCDNKYPLLKKRIVASLQKLFPKNKVGTVVRGDNCTDIYLYSNQLEKLLGWKANHGSKFLQNVTTPLWVKQKDDYKIPYLRGLVETDGSIYKDRGYLMMMFTTIIKDLGSEVCELINSLGFKARFYSVNQKSNKYGYHRQSLYHVRLSKDVQRFLDMIQPRKN